MQITRTGSIEGSRREIDDRVKGAAAATIEFWHRTMMPDHFTEAGFTKYGYQLRKGQDEPYLVYRDGGNAKTARIGKYGRLVRNRKYYWEKQKRKGIRDPLVYSGTSEQQAKAGIRLSVRNVRSSGMTRAVGVMDLPKYFYQYNPKYGAPDKADELTRTTPDEQQILAREFEKALNWFSNPPPVSSSAEVVASS